MNALSIIALVGKLLPIIVNAINTMEELDQSAGNGKEKLAAALTIIKNTYLVAFPDAAVKFEQIQSAIEGIIAAIVNFNNLKGIFKKKTA